MGSYTITTTPEEDTALAWKAAQPDTTVPVPPDVLPPPLTPEEYLDKHVHDELAQYVQQYNIATSSNPPIDVATAYANADVATQAQVDAILGLPPPATQTRRAP